VCGTDPHGFVEAFHDAGGFFELGIRRNGGSGDDSFENFVRTDTLVCAACD
jgi:hypothetical protein